MTNLTLLIILNHSESRLFVVVQIFAKFHLLGLLASKTNIFEHQMLKNDNICVRHQILVSYTDIIVLGPPNDLY